MHSWRTDTALKVAAVVVIVRGGECPARHPRVAGVGPARIRGPTVLAIAPEAGRTGAAVVAASRQVGPAADPRVARAG